MITVFGSINLDLVFTPEHLPAPGETVLGRSVSLQPGGKGANQALAAARDGVTVAMVGAVGRDSLAETALGLLRAEGVALHLVESEETTGCAAIVTDRAGRNQIAVGSGANLAARAGQLEGIAGGGWLLLQMELLRAETEAAVRWARASGWRVMLNLAPAGALEPALLRAVEVLVANEPEAGWLAGHLGVAAEGLDAALGVTVVRTLGAAGAAYAGPLGSGRVPGHAVDVVDTTAAGDCFAGVLAAGLDRGLELESAIGRANRAAALCCTRAGSQQSLPRSAEIDAF